MPTFTVLLGNRRIELAIPIAGFAAGLALLLGLRGNPAGATSVEPGTLSRAAVKSQGSVSGMVLDRHGDPVPGARVMVIGEGGSILADERASASSESPSPLGSFRIDHLPTGTYVLAASAPGSPEITRVARVPVSSFDDTRVRIRIDLGY